MPRQAITEATTRATATPIEGSPGRFLIQLISPGWGSSGYYSPAVLEAAGEARVFPKGLHMYLDHPTATEEYDRPERTVRDLASVLEEDARWDRDLNALVGEATVFGPYRTMLDPSQGGIGDAIGVSIRAAAEVEPGEAEGRHGPIITELVEGISADYVTHAGRGGKILQVIESAQPVTEARNIGQWIESRIHRDFTITADDMAGDGRLTREERISLSGAIGDALAAFVNRLEADAPQLYQRDLWEDPTDTVATAMEALRDVPSHPAGRNNTPGGTMPEIAESELRTLREAAGRVQTLETELSTERQARESAESERDTERQRADTAEGRIAESERATTVARILGEACEAASVELNPFERDGIAARAVRGEDGAVDETRTRTAFDEALTSLTEAAGAGRVRGFGGPVRTNTSEAKGEDLNAELDKLAEATFGPVPTIKEA